MSNEEVLRKRTARLRWDGSAFDVRETDAIDALLAERVRAERERDELRAVLMIPGEQHCPEYGLRLHKLEQGWRKMVRAASASEAKAGVLGDKLKQAEARVARLAEALRASKRDLSEIHGTALLILEHGSRPERIHAILNRAEESLDALDAALAKAAQPAQEAQAHALGVVKP